MMTEVLLGGLVLLVLWIFVVDKRPKGLPPGEWGWPVVGAWKPFGVSVEDHVKALQRKHGDIFTWRVGSLTLVFVNNFSLIKQAFANTSLQDRPDLFTIDNFTELKKIGLLNSNGATWVNGRRFALRLLKDLGMGKSSLMDAIQFEVAHMVEDIKKHTGRAQPIPWSLNVAVLNVVWKLTADCRFDVDDPKIQSFNKLITEAFNDTQGPSMLFDLLPWLPSITPTFIRERMGTESMLDKFTAIKEYMMTVIDEHERKLDAANPKDYIDFYLVEMKAQQDNPRSTMDKDDLMIHVGDLFTAGSETIIQTLRWSLLYLAKHPEIQKRAQSEIDREVDRDRLPALEDKPKLHYLEAVILEVGRIISLLPLGIAHFASEDTTLAGYKIPKRTVIVANHEKCHMDPTIWEKPDEFYPEHFLDKEGKLLGRRENYLPFSIGRRVCVGEALARMELYLFLSALLQNFTFSVPEGEDVQLKKEPSSILFNFTTPQKVVIDRRA